MNYVWAGSGLPKSCGFNSRTALLASSLCLVCYIHLASIFFHLPMPYVLSPSRFLSVLSVIYISPLPCLGSIFFHLPMPYVLSLSRFLSVLSVICISPLPSLGSIFFHLPMPYVLSMYLISLHMACAWRYNHPLYPGPS